MSAALPVIGVLGVAGVAMLAAGYRIYDAAIGLIGAAITGPIAFGYVASHGFWQASHGLIGLGWSAVVVLGTAAMGYTLAIGLHHLIVIGNGFLWGAGAAILLLQGGGMPMTPTGAFAGAQQAVSTPGTAWLPALVGGVIGAGVAWLLFRASLIFLTSAIGAGLVSGAVNVATGAALPPLNPQYLLGHPGVVLETAQVQSLLFVGLFLAGVLLQAGQALTGASGDGAAAADADGAE